MAELQERADKELMDKIVSLAKRRGFVYQSSEIYGGLSGAWDYGPLGIELKNNIQRFWWKEMTRRHENIVGIDAAILMHPKVWEASGHVANFSDPLVDCKKCKGRFRADHIDLNAPCPNCGAKGEFTEPRQFNLMFKTELGSSGGPESTVYLRPETAQGIYVNFKNVCDTSRVKVPFGIAQVGKAFRNEIVTKSFIFRSCEFEQMEMQYFVHPSKAEDEFESWRKQRLAYYDRMGIITDRLRWHHHGTELAHYAKNAYDIEYLFPFGWKELEGIHNRSDFDLTQHAKYCGKPITYLDDETKERFVPWIIETSAGLTRSLLMALCDAYEEEVVSPAGVDENGKAREEDVRTVLRFHPEIAPVQVGVFPLVKKDGLSEIASELCGELAEDYSTFYDASGAIGRRYRRQDEVGTPFCVTVDYDTKENGTVTLRFRDSMAQVRVHKSELAAEIKKAIKSYKRVQPQA
jgi:glycyl-tRNA synthetase